MTPPFPTAADYASEPVRHPPLTVVDIASEGGAITDAYRNIVLFRVNDHCLRLAVFDQAYAWHKHPKSDELFLVVEGCLVIDLADGRQLRLGPWEAATVPAGTVHRTRAEGRTVNLCVEAQSADTEFVAGPEGG